MSKKNLIACAAMLILLSAGPGFAAHPLVSDDAGILGKGAVQIELIGDIGYDNETAGGSTTKANGAQIATTIGVGVGDKADLTFGMTRPWGSGDTDGASFNDAGRMDFSLTIKCQVYEHDGFSIAVKPQLGYSYAVGVKNDYTMSYGAALVLSKELEPFTFHLNTGYTYNDHSQAVVRAASRTSIWSFSLAAVYELVKDLKLAVDFGAAANEVKAVSEMPVFGLGGLIYTVNRNLDLGSGLKVGLTKPETDLTGTFGVTIKF